MKNRITRKPNNSSETGVIKKPGLLEIFLLFFKIGSIGFGGGPALISIIQQEVVEKKKWIDGPTFVQGLAISLMPPGSIMVNISFFAGDLVRGFAGGLAALFGILLPSFFIMVILAGVLVATESLDIKRSAMKGLAPAVVGVLAAMVFRMSREQIQKWQGVILMAVSTLLMFYFKVPPYVLIIVAFIIGGISWGVNKDRYLMDECKKRHAKEEPKEKMQAEYKEELAKESEDG